MSAAVENAKFQKVLQLIAVLKAGRWTIKQLVDRFDISKSALYRYLAMLEDCGFCLDKDFHNRHFIVTTENAPLQEPFTVDEIHLLRTLLHGGQPHALKDAVLRKLALRSELDSMPNLFMKAHLGGLVDQLHTAMRNRHQVWLRKYHSANSSQMRDRLVEPIHFSDNYNTLVALEVRTQTCKQFKLDRIHAITETHKTFAHESLHRQQPSDVFGMAGPERQKIQLHLSVRAYLLLREEYPQTLPYITKHRRYYKLKAPVANFLAPARFVMGLLDEVTIVGPAAFKALVKTKVANAPW